MQVQGTGIDALDVAGGKPSVSRPSLHHDSCGDNARGDVAGLSLPARLWGGETVPAGQSLS